MAENQAFIPCSASRILEHQGSLDDVVSSAASCFSSGSHWIFHRGQNFLNPPIGLRSDLAKLPRFCPCLQRRHFVLLHELRDLTGRLWRGKYSGGLFKTRSCHFSRRSLIVMTTHLLIPHIRLISTFDLKISRFILRMLRRQLQTSSVHFYVVTSLTRFCIHKEGLFE